MRTRRFSIETGGNRTRGAEVTDRRSGDEHFSASHFVRVVAVERDVLPPVEPGLAEGEHID
jgi:hypothetical protein